MNPKSIDVEDLKKFSKAFCKHEILFDTRPEVKNKRNLKAHQDNAYKMLVEELGLQSVESAKRLLKSVRRIVTNKMRRLVRLSTTLGHSAYDAIQIAPRWLVVLDEPLGLLEKAVKMETLYNWKQKSRASHFRWELLRSAKSAAQRAAAAGGAGGARALAAVDAMSDYAERLQLDEDHTKQLHNIWVRFYDQSVYKLMALIEVGDNEHNVQPPERISAPERRAADLALLYDTRLRVLRENTFTCSMALYPLILLFKLMVKVKQLVDNDELKSLIGRQDDETGAQCGTTSELDDFEDMKGLNTYEIPQVWALVHLVYKKRGSVASAILLQKRWYELKQLARMRVLAAARAPLAPAPLLLALVKRFPYVVTEKMPTWTQLVKHNRVYSDVDLMPYRMKRLEPTPILQVSNRIDETAIFEELNDSSDSDVEIIADKKETITVYDSDDEQTDTITDRDKAHDGSDSIDNNMSIEALESFDPTQAKVKIIFDDSDSDFNDDINNMKQDKTLETATEDNLIKNADVPSISNIRSRLDFEESDTLNDIQFEEENNDLNKHNNDNIVINSESNDKTDVNFKVSNDISNLNLISNDNDLESLNDKVQNDDEIDTNTLLVDEKLVNLCNVILTPVEHLDAWQKFAKNKTINCRRFSVRNFSKRINLTSDKLSKCRRYIRKPQTGLNIEIINEIAKIPKKLRRKRTKLTRNLKLSRTDFSSRFWNERNIELLGRCKPVSVDMEKRKRTVKKIELPDITEVRRINKTILTAQVAPITVGKNRTLVIDPLNTETSRRKEQVPDHTEDSTTITKEITTISETNILINNSYQNTPLPALTLKFIPTGGLDSAVTKSKEDSSQDDNTDSINDLLTKNNLTETDVKRIVKKIISKSALPKLQRKTILVSSQSDPHFDTKQQTLDKDIELFLMYILKTEQDNRPCEKRKKKKTRPIEDRPSCSSENSDESSSEWLRQKEQNKQYFNFVPTRNIPDKQLDIDKTIGLNNLDIVKENDVINKKNNDSNKNVNNPSISGTKVIKNKANINVDKILDQIEKLKTNKRSIDGNDKNAKLDEEYKEIAVIDLCDDSNDELEANPSKEHIVTSKIRPNDVVKPELNIKILKNSIQISGDGKSDALKKSEEILTFLSKVATQIQDNNTIPNNSFTTAQITNNNSTVYYVIKTVDKDTTNTSPATQTVANTNPSQYYVLKLADQNSVAENAIQENTLMPIIQSVSSLNEDYNRNDSSVNRNDSTNKSKIIESDNSVAQNQIQEKTLMPIIQSVSSLNEDYNTNGSSVNRNDSIIKSKIIESDSVTVESSEKSVNANFSNIPTVESSIEQSLKTKSLLIPMKRKHSQITTNNQVFSKSNDASDNRNDSTEMELESNILTVESDSEESVDTNSLQKPMRRRQYVILPNNHKHYKKNDSSKIESKNLEYILPVESNIKDSLNTNSFLIPMNQRNSVTIPITQEYSTTTDSLQIKPIKVEYNVPIEYSTEESHDTNSLLVPMNRRTSETMPIEFSTTNDSSQIEYDVPIESSFEESLDTKSLLVPMRRRNSELMPINSVTSSNQARSTEDNVSYPVIVSSGPSGSSQVINNYNLCTDQNRQDATNLPKSNKLNDPSQNTAEKVHTQRQETVEISKKLSYPDTSIIPGPSRRIKVSKSNPEQDDDTPATESPAISPNIVKYWREKIKDQLNTQSRKTTQLPQWQKK